MRDPRAVHLARLPAFILIYALDDLVSLKPTCRGAVSHNSALLWLEAINNWRQVADGWRLQISPMPSMTYKNAVPVLHTQRQLKQHNHQRVKPRSVPPLWLHLDFAIIFSSVSLVLHLTTVSQCKHECTKTVSLLVVALSVSMSFKCWCSNWSREVDAIHSCLYGGRR